MEKKRTKKEGKKKIGPKIMPREKVRKTTLHPVMRRCHKSQLNPHRAYQSPYHKLRTP